MRILRSARAAIVILAAVACGFGCTRAKSVPDSPAAESKIEKSAKPTAPRKSNIEHLYVLSFDAWGELQNPSERELAIEELRDNPEIERIIILSYGWANDGRAAYSTYRRIVNEMTANLPTEVARRKVAVIAVGWDSSQSGFRKLFNDLIPLPGIGDALAWLPDHVLFPISFWSKAAQADRIGYGGLRSALNQIFSIYEGKERHPEILLIGHSFGTRIVSGLMAGESGRLQPSAESFRAASYVRGAALLQPALVPRNLDRNADYPLLITMSSHDHAVGFMYPIANIPLNAYGFTLFESLIQKHLFDPVGKGIEKSTGMVTGVVTDVVTGAVTTVVPGARKPAEPEAIPAQSEDERSNESRLGRIERNGRRTGAELVALPLTLGFTAVATPIDYVFVQAWDFATHPFSHVMDSLAQIPVVEIPVAGLSAALHRDPPWGQRSKGIFTLGPLHEGLGRMPTPQLIQPIPLPVYSIEELSKMEKAPKGIFVADCSDIVKRGAFKVDLNNPLADFTVSWIDPIGAHSDFTNKGVMSLLSWLANGTPIDIPKK